MTKLLNYKEFEKKCLDKIKEIEISKECLEKDFINKYKFRMKASADISFDLISDAHKLINRRKAFDRINEYVDNEYISHNIEKGLYEASLLHITTKKMDNSFISSVYEFKLHTICINLDENNEKIQNKTLLQAIYKGDLKPYMIAFLSPQQMHPEKWETFKQRRIREDDAMYNPETTDEYECSKCKERKCTVEYIQLRSADEPANKFIVCVVCGTTVIQ